MKKTLYNRFKTGILKGWYLPTLPKHLLEFNDKPLVKIFRFLGGLSTLLILTKRLQILGEGNLYFIALIICFIFSLSFGFYLIYLNYYRIKHIYKVIKSGEADV